MAVLAMTVFEGARVSGSDMELVGAEDVEETNPLAKS